MRKILFIFLIYPLFVSCTKHIIGGEYQGPKSYIQGFYELNDIYVYRTCGVFKVNKENNLIIIDGNYDDSKVYGVEDGVGIIVSIGSEDIGKGFITWYREGSSDYYHELVEKIGDTSYDPNLIVATSPGEEMIAVADTIQSVNITCDKQIDVAHPAGSSLNDMFSIYFEDPLAVIDNGYRTPVGENYYTPEATFEIDKKIPCVFFGAKLSSVDFSSKLHMGRDWWLILETAPENTGEYTFTVSITNKQGYKLEKIANPIKIKDSNQ